MDYWNDAWENQDIDEMTDKSELRESPHQNHVPEDVDASLQVRRSDAAGNPKALIENFNNSFLCK